VPTAGCTVAEPIGKTPGLGVEEDLASRSKKVLRFDSSNLTADREGSTSGFHSMNDLSNAAGSQLEGYDVLPAPLVHERELEEAVVDDGLVGNEAVTDHVADLLHELLEHELDIGIHGA
jgi:hypothetical protein